MLRTNIVLAFFFISTGFCTGQPLSAETLARTFIEALASVNKNKAQALLIDIPTIRILYSEELKEKSDKDIEEIYHTSFLGKFEKDFGNLLASAEKNGMDISKLTYFSHRIEKPYGDEPGKPFAMEIRYGYEEKEGSIALSVVESLGGYHLLEILNSFNWFDRLFR